MKVQRRLQRGFSLIEAIIALGLLSVGTAGALALSLAAVQTNNGTKRDAGAMYVAQTVMERLSQPPRPNGAGVTHVPVQIVDCAPTPVTWTMTTAPGGAAVDAYGAISWSTQAYEAIPAGYAMRFTSCGAAGAPTVYEVRWNVQQLNGAYSKLITVSARAARSGRARFLRPIQLRTIVSM